MGGVKYLSNSRDDASLLGQHFLDILIGVEAKWWIKLLVHQL
jgi:hypothetical protein